MIERTPPRDKHRMELDHESERLANALIAYDEELRSGAWPSILTDSVADKLSPESCRKFFETAECIRHLHVERVSQTWIRESERSAPTDALLSPQHLGRFKIIRQLGKGGHGVVLLAYDPRLDREVSIKLPRVDVSLANDSAECFVREARAIAAMSHPNIIEVYEICNLGPVYFIVQAYCEGPSLKEWFNDK
jgi:serine/threonine protein kinase